MKPFFLHRILQSEKNGRIDVWQYFGVVKVIVDGYEQSGKYLQLMWRDALARVPSDVPAKRVLMLGLAGGIAIQEIYRTFPDAEVTVIEWDPMMVEASRLAGCIPADRTPRIITGDAFEEVAKLGEKFDIVLVDIFRGGIPDARLASDEFAMRLGKSLNRDGSLILNAFESLEFLPAFERCFQEHITWKYEYNTLALFRRFMYS
jgi:spermidine synthase